MARAIDSRFYKQSQWVKCRNAYLKQNPLCELCLTRGKYVPSKYVHHKIALNEENVKDNRIAYGFENLQALCYECHEEQHVRRKSKRRYKIRADGTVDVIS